MQRSFVRRRYIVDWKLQGSLCLHGLLYGLLVLVAVSCGIFLPLLWNLGEQTNLAGIEEQAIVMLYMHERFWFLAVTCAGIVVLGAIRFSHRIAGPLVRYKRNLRLLADGRLPPPLRTRDGDYLQEEVACLNAAVAGVGARVEAIRRAQLALRHEVFALTANAPQSPQLAALCAASQELERQVAAFQPTDPGDDLLPVAAPQLVTSVEGG